MSRSLAEITAALTPLDTIEERMDRAHTMVTKANAAIEQIRAAGDELPAASVVELAAALHGIRVVDQEDEDAHENEHFMKDVRSLFDSLAEVMQRHTALQENEVLLDDVLYIASGTRPENPFLNKLSRERQEKEYREQAYAARGTPNDCWAYRFYRKDIPDGVVDGMEAGGGWKSVDDIMREISKRKKVIGPKDKVVAALQRLGITIPGFAEAEPRQGWIANGSSDGNPDRYRYQQAKLVFIDDAGQVAMVQVGHDSGGIYRLLKEKAGLRLVDDERVTSKVIPAMESVSRMLDIKI